jgi:hypothetical protein
MTRHLPSAALCLLFAFVPGAVAADTAGFRVTPPTVNLDGNFARCQLVVTPATTPGALDEHAADLTHRAAFSSSDPRVITVGPTGVLLGSGNGKATVTVTVSGGAQTVPVVVTGVLEKPVIGFREQVIPILTKAGCNAGACHASQYGKGGFKLSVFVSQPEEDHRAMTHDNYSRRVNPVDPASSLLLLKATHGVPHEGGRRLQRGSVDYEILSQWQRSGSPGIVGKTPEVIALHVWPARRVGFSGGTQQLRVTASFNDGKERDVTHWARFTSMDDGVVRVSPGGRVENVGRGQGTVLVRFSDHAEIATFVAPFADTVELSGFVERNYIDHLAAAKFREIGIAPSPLCDDATFLRRAFLDAIGTLPTAEEARAFLESKEPDKRDRLIDALLGLTGDPAKDIHNNAYAAWWTLKWADLVRSNSATLGEQGMWALHNWMTGSFRDNKRFDRFVRELITARGSTFSNGPANYYRVGGNNQEWTEATAQIFLGVRVQCAKCHHHPFEKISQADYYGFAAFFARVGTKTSQEFGIFGNETVVVVRADGEVGHPKTGALLRPTPLHGKPIAAEPPDRRAALADWMTAPDNPYFARNIVNRYFGYLMGHGLVEPIDDVRATNPPSNAALLDALAADFVKSGYDVKQLLRTIMRSRLYQLQSQPTPGNATDRRFYSHYSVKRLQAEALLDALVSATGVPTKFTKVPLGTRAIELPDSRYDNYLLKAFGKPRREGVCECERVAEPNLAQALHTLNGDTVSTKVGSPQGRIAQLIAAKKPPEAIVAELYLATLSRFPTAAEQETCRKWLAESGDPRAFYEDLQWSLINSKHFLFIR